MSTPRTACSLSWRSPPTRPACPTSRTWRSPAWASTCSRRPSCSTSCGGMAAAPPPPANLAPAIAPPPSQHEFGRDIIPHIVTHGHAVAHRFTRSCVRSTYESEAYWRDVGTVDAYWAANIDLTDVVPALDLYDHEWPIWTYGEITPPAKFVHNDDGRRGASVDSLVSGGCIVSGSA